VIEGTRKEHPDESDWVPYEFEGRPVRTGERPPQWAPYRLRLDWRLWFAAMRSRPTRRRRWLFGLLEALLEGDDATLDLLADAPFEDAPETVRVSRYRFTTPEERGARLRGGTSSDRVAAVRCRRARVIDRRQPPAVPAQSRSAGSRAGGVFDSTFPHRLRLPATNR
jgi:hypothetical protein